MAELMMKLKQDLHNGLPVTLAPFLTSWLGCAAFVAVIQLVQGCAKC